MHRNPRPDSVWLTPILVGWVGIVVAQASFTLAFDPDGRSLRMSVESKGEMVLVGIPGTPDSTVFETFALAGVTQRADRIGGDRFSFDVTYDSLRARYRTGEQPWIDGQFAFTAPVTIGFTTDRRMMLSAPIYSGDSATAEHARSGTGAPHFVLPSDPIDIGGPWRSEVLLPFAAEIPGTSGGIVNATLSGPAIGLLDSIVPRGADTLLYLTARGQFLPVTVNSTVVLGGLPATAELWGQFTSRLIWSTGWNAFVSVVLTARVYQRFEAAGESGGNDSRVTSTFTTRVRVRP